MIPLELLIAIGIATAVPLFAFFIIYSFDLFSLNTRNTVLMCFGWGIISFAIALGLNTLLLNAEIVTLTEVRRYVAPIEEEILKATILVLLVRRRTFTYFVDGAVFGFAIGIGFAIVENYYYLYNEANALGAAIGRVISTNLMHGAASAILGIGLGLSARRHSGDRIRIVVIGWLLATLIHILFNNLVDRELVTGTTLLLVSAGFGMAGAAFIGWLIREGIQDQKAWMDDLDYGSNRVTDQEIKNVKDIEEVMLRVTEQFPEYSKEIRRLVVIQANLGKKQQETRDFRSINNQAASEEAEYERAELQKEMEAIRQSLGSYVMLSLRHIVPLASEKLSALESLGTKVKAREENRGGGLWDNLQRSTKEQPS